MSELMHTYNRDLKGSGGFHEVYIIWPETSWKGPTLQLGEEKEKNGSDNGSYGSYASFKHSGPHRGMCMTVMN